jgi:hypothetical protein
MVTATLPQVIQVALHWQDLHIKEMNTNWASFPVRVYLLDDHDEFIEPNGLLWDRGKYVCDYLSHGPRSLLSSLSTVMMASISGTSSSRPFYAEASTLGSSSSRPFFVEPSTSGLSSLRPFFAKPLTSGSFTSRFLSMVASTWGTSSSRPFYYAET